MIPIPVPELEKTPAFPDHCPERWRPLWDAGWNLVQRSVQPPCGRLNKPWLSIGPGYFMPAFGHWDLAQSVLNIVEFAPGFAQQQIELLLNLMREDGSLPGLVRCLSVKHFRYSFSWKKERQSPGKFEIDWRRWRLLHLDFGYASPPLWPLAIIPIWERTGDDKFLLRSFDAAVKHIGWWQRNRQMQALDPLFFYNDHIPDTKWESGYDASPRWEAIQAGGLKVACVDISAQMKMVCDAVASMAGHLGKEKEKNRWTIRRLELSAAIQEHLWDDAAGMFFDRQVQGHKFRIRTSASFWPMVARAATSVQVDSLAALLNDPNQFGTKVPVPSVAKSEAAYKELDAWRGPTWLSQTFWIARGLRGYEYYSLASKILERALDEAACKLEQEGVLFEFYHPEGGAISELRRKGMATGPLRDYLGHNPIHAMMIDWLKSQQLVSGSR